MFRRRKVKPWFNKTLKNLFVLFLIYRFARSFLIMAEKQGRRSTVEKKKSKRGKK